MKRPLRPSPAYVPARARLRVAVVSVVVGAAAVAACIDPPPKIPAIPPSGLAVRLHVFGADATEARQAFQAVKQNNRSFSLVNEGGDGEIVVGLENDSPKCVQPTALCAFKVSYRVRDRNGEVVHRETTTISATATTCNDLCSKALVNVATKVVEQAAALLGSSASPDDAGTDPEAGTALADASTMAPDAASDAGSKKRPSKSDPAGAKAEPSMCSVGAGARLPSEEAERRAAQVEALKRMNVLDQAEYDCLRKAYLNRL